MNNQKIIGERFDWTLALILFAFFIISCISIYSAQTTGQYDDNYFVKQIIYYIIGVVIIGAVIFLDSYQFRKLSWYLYGFGIFLLIALLLAPESIAPIRNGAKSWFVIKGIGSIQPSEFMKIFLILALSRVVSDHQEKNPVKTLQTDFQLFFKLGLTAFVPFLLVVAQDLGTALVIFVIFLGILFVSGISWKILIPFFTSIAGIVGLIFFLVIRFPDFVRDTLKVDTYQLNRIYSWLNPESFQSGSGYHLYKSLQAIGSGLITGKGFGERAVYIPESHTDFIFSIIGEEYGFVGASIVIGLFFLLIYHLIKIALETIDPFNTYICVGIISMIAFHVFQNIGMTIQLVPITGIPLPFISSGGSSLMANMFAMGIVFSIKYHHKNYMFRSEKK